MVDVGSLEVGGGCVEGFGKPRPALAVELKGVGQVLVVPVASSIVLGGYLYYSWCVRLGWRCAESWGTAACGCEGIELVGRVLSWYTCELTCLTHLSGGYPLYLNNAKICFIFYFLPIAYKPE